jgi:hypothetical protein
MAWGAQKKVPRQDGGAASRSWLSSHALRPTLFQYRVWSYHYQWQGGTQAGRRDRGLPPCVYGGAALLLCCFCGACCFAICCAVCSSARLAAHSRHVWRPSRCFQQATYTSRRSSPHHHQSAPSLAPAIADERVSTELKKQIIQARTAKKLTQAQLGQVRAACMRAACSVRSPAPPPGRCVAAGGRSNVGS